MKEEVVSIINGIVDLGDEICQTKDLISGGHLDSFSVLILVSQLEEHFKVSLEFGEDLFIRLDSVDKIVELIKTTQQGADG